MAGLHEFKCPCCGGAVEFNSGIQKMKCPYCDTEFDMEALSDYETEKAASGSNKMDWDLSDSSKWSESEGGGLHVYTCESCGGEIMADENTAANVCPFCGNPVVMMKSISGELRPEYIIPFKLDKKAAVEGFRKHLSKKKLLPDSFRDETHLNEITGLYVPYWLFNTKADADMRYRATKVRHWSDSKYDYTETSHYLVTRGGTLDFADVPVDGSVKLADDLMESLEPYDTSEAEKFNPGFFAGYAADRYDVPKEKAAERANERVVNSTTRVFRDQVNGYTTVTSDGGTIKLRGGKVAYAMYPVWLMTTRWQDKIYTFAMNGQTGKFVGNLPVDKKRRLRYFFITAGIVSAAVFLLLLLIANV